MKLLSAVTPPLSQYAPSIRRLSSFKVQLVKNVFVIFSWFVEQVFPSPLGLFFFFYHPHGSGVSEPS